MIVEFLHKIRWLLLICVVFLIGYAVYQVTTYKVYYNSSTATIVNHPAERFFIWCSTDTRSNKHKATLKYTMLVGNDRSYLSPKEGWLRFSCAATRGDVRITVADSKKKVYYSKPLGFDDVTVKLPKGKKYSLIVTGKSFSGKVYVKY